VERRRPGDAERLINHGLRKVEILPGNIGYLLVDEFAGGDGVGDAIAGALRFLERTDALIIDVRNNRGGSGEMSHLLFSHFLGASPVPTIRVRDRVRGTDEVLPSDSIVPGPRRTDVPLYVLTSRATVSAAEEFAFVLRRLKRATLVGDRTIGAGHMNAISPIGHGFTLSVSFARVSDPETGAEWEKVGVQPHIAVPPAQALDKAQALALRAIAERTSDPMRGAQLRSQAEVADARMAGKTASPAVLASAPGRYTGGRLVEATGGVLWYTGLNGQRTELVAVGDDWFALGDQRMRFEGDRIVVKRPDGSTYAFDRMR
jgi:retinol-binding protein 3